MLADLPEVLEVVPVSHSVNHLIRDARWEGIIERASQDFVSEQLQREPFCTISLVEVKLRSLTNRLNNIERDLVRQPPTHIYSVLVFIPILLKGADSKKIVLFEEGRTGVKAEADGQGDLEPDIVNGRFASIYYRHKLTFGVV